MLRKIVKIDEEKCDGCGDCVPNCHEGALQIIDDKARLISDLFCDGLGACIGHCPQGAITIEEREAEPYDETKVMEYIVKGGRNVIIAHLKHLIEHNEMDYYKEAVQYLKDNDIENPLNGESVQPQQFSGCPGSKAMSFENKEVVSDESGKRESHLTQWPIQLHLVSPFAQYYKNSNLLLAADCVGFAYADFHKDFMKEKSIAIACPKLDTNKQVYLDKLTAMINESNIQSITVLIMQVPCCGGLLQLAQLANDSANRKVPINSVVIGVNGEVLEKTLVA
ncbi:MAG: 4Fe-4S binding protein [Ignavibacteria bacterium]|nr:4Fe-4S binding protein [Ignavibacteria bacterium]MBT8390350.1 4Fe-4S binding protein [Ignavibacteria bacterium]NNJ51551.1 4Fe-4S binding protein [Ignavibacteriaceae bacterium]NNL19942.1 4Fe-4S binding protein [Ignavibacteriaceae bacterium]